MHHIFSNWVFLRSKEELETLLDKLKAFCKEKDISKFTPRSEGIFLFFNVNVNRWLFCFLS